MDSDHKLPDGRTSIPKEVPKHSTPDGHIHYDISSILQSPEFKEHLIKLDNLVKRGIIPRHHK